MSDLFDENVNKMLEEAVEKKKKPRPPPPTFYEVIERFIEKHEGTDRVSQEFELLAERLRSADPEYVELFACLTKANQQIAMQFCYRMLQQKD